VITARKKIAGLVRTSKLILRFSLPIVLVLVATRAGTAATSPTLIGANYSHYGLVGCSFDGYGILANGTFNRKTVKQQLAAMRAAGIETLRLFIWHMHDASGQYWGVVTSAGGRLGDAERTNLILSVPETHPRRFGR
jgi:hypothetical protein